MSKATGWLKDLEKRNVHFINHGELHCPVKKHNENVYYYTNRSIVPQKRKLIEFCSMCGYNFEKRITKEVNEFTKVIE